MRLQLLNEIRVRYFEQNDVQPVATGKKLKATLVNPDGGEPFWIPNSQIRQATIVDKETGEIVFDGYWVNDWWLRRNNQKLRRLRRAAFDYSKNGLPVKSGQVVHKGSATR